MARSLTVSHEENLTVNWLFAGFLLVAVGWLMLFSLTASSDANASSIEGESNPEQIALSEE